MNNISENSKINYLNLINKNNNGIFLITKDNCSLCVKLKELFDKINIKYSIYTYEETQNEIENNYPFKTEMKNHTGGKMFPFCYFNCVYVGGYKELHHNFITGKLQEQLNKIGIFYEEEF